MTKLTSLACVMLAMALYAPIVVMAADEPSPMPTPPMPAYDYAAYCNRSVSMSGGMDKTALETCYDAEVAAHNELSPDWGDLDAETRKTCRERAEFALRPSYATLRDCVAEMTGD